ncbi:hypothetical protein D9613_000455 [Agrocybe pediades]|uniref:Aldehyde dehydrogenase n=1 Tax=Agrocybe pediades TaxID=84607 RepID=A0A8H4QZ99_9AGAR|nr:hypothetical protein D9613_000455 [Agrocybe pediades]
MSSYKQLSDLPAPIVNLKAAFDTGLSRPLGWRRKQIEGIHDLIQKNTDLLANAALEDDRLNRAEVLLELTSALQLAKSKVAELVAYEKSRNSFSSASKGVIGNRKARVANRSNPSGIVLVKADWAYPYSSLLNSAIVSLASGNLCLLSPTFSSVSSTLSHLLPRFLDHSAYAILDSNKLDKSSAQLISGTTASLTNLTFSPSGSVTVSEAVEPASAPAIAYVHETGNAQAAGQALVHAKLAFNGRSPFAPSIAFIDDAIYDDVLVAVKSALSASAPRAALRNENGALSSFVNDASVKKVNSWVLEAGRSATFTISNGRLPFLILSRVASPDAAVDRVKLLPGVSAFYIYAAEPYRSYVVDEVDSIVTVVNDIPLEMLINPFETPFSADNTTKILTRPQKLVISKPSKISLGHPTLSGELSKKIAQSAITRLNEGDGTRWDFFVRVKMVFTGVKYLTYATALTSAFLVYRRYRK